jgi:hypothetical protein
LLFEADLGIVAIISININCRIKPICGYLEKKDNPPPKKKKKSEAMMNKMKHKEIHA